MPIHGFIDNFALVHQNRYMDEIRLFIAIELNEGLRGELNRAQKQLQDERGMRMVRWVAPENIHLTLKFLGNVERGRVPELTAALVRAAKDSAPFELTTRGLGCFPNVRRPNNVWVGLEGDVPSAALLARRIETEFGALGFAQEAHGFTPHLTLGRVKREASNSDRAAVGETVKRFPGTTYGVIHADRVCLIASDLRPSGPIYNILGRAELGTK